MKRMSAPQNVKILPDGTTMSFDLITGATKYRYEFSRTDDKGQVLPMGNYEGRESKYSLAKGIDEKVLVPGVTYQVTITGDDGTGFGLPTIVKFKVEDGRIVIISTETPNHEESETRGRAGAAKIVKWAIITVGIILAGTILSTIAFLAFNGIRNMVKAPATVVGETTNNNAVVGKTIPPGVNWSGFINNNPSPIDPTSAVIPNITVVTSNLTISVNMSNSHKGQVNIFSSGNNNGKIRVEQNQEHQAPELDQPESVIVVPPLEIVPVPESATNANPVPPTVTTNQPTKEGCARMSDKNTAATYDWIAQAQPAVYTTPSQETIPGWAGPVVVPASVSSPYYNGFGTTYSAGVSYGYYGYCGGVRYYSPPIILGFAGRSGHRYGYNGYAPVVHSRPVEINAYRYRIGGYDRWSGSGSNPGRGYYTSQPSYNRGGGGYGGHGYYNYNSQPSHNYGVGGYGGHGGSSSHGNSGGRGRR